MILVYEYLGYRLKLPHSFISADTVEKSRVCNGMGPEGFGWMIPDTMYGLDLSPAGDIHDWMYEYPEGLTKEQCDDTFYENMKRIIEQDDGWAFTKWLRGRRAWKYYKAVQVGGKEHFNGGGSF